MSPESIFSESNGTTRGNSRRNYAQDRALAQMNPDDTRIANPHSASKRTRAQENFSTLPLLCHNETAMGKTNPATWGRKEYGSPVTAGLWLLVIGTPYPEMTPLK
jgi:hypothetical protein